MAGELSVDLCLVLALGALWVAGLSTRVVLLALLMLAVVRYLNIGSPKENGRKSSDVKPSNLPSEGGTALSGTFVPSTGQLDLSKGEIHVTENENCHCTCYVLARPTDDPDRDAAGAYPGAAHFHGRKRLWEMRWQIRVKRRPQRPLVFGLELSEYVPVSGWSRRVQQMTVATLRSVVGKDLYHSCGDNPNQVSGEAERPVFVMPLWAFDQLIVSEPGEEPDIRNIKSLGVLRTDNRSEFIRELSSLEMQPDKVYTAAFWCISRFVDVVNWQLLGVVPGGINFNTFCGKPPVHIVIYELEDAADTKDQRHLPSRKKYYCNLALWSSKCPISSGALRALLPEAPSGAPERQVFPEEPGGPQWCCWR